MNKQPRTTDPVFIRPVHLPSAAIVLFAKMPPGFQSRFLASLDAEGNRRFQTALANYRPGTVYAFPQTLLKGALIPAQAWWSIVPVCLSFVLAGALLLVAKIKGIDVTTYWDWMLTACLAPLALYFMPMASRRLLWSVRRPAAEVFTSAAGVIGSFAILCGLLVWATPDPMPAALNLGDEAFWFIISAAVFGAVAEEVAFRWFLVGVGSGLTGHYLTAWLFSSVLFALAHGTFSGTELVALTAFGFVLCIVRRFTNSLIFPWIGHAGANVAVLTL